MKFDIYLNVDVVMLCFITIDRINVFVLCSSLQQYVVCYLLEHFNIRNKQEETTKCETKQILVAFLVILIF